MKVIFVTGNEKKLREVQKLLQDCPLEITSQKIDLPELQGSIEDISIQKCRAAADIVKGPVFTDDTSLCFDAMNGLPGPYIKWFLQELGHEGLNRMLDGFDSRRAKAVNTLAYCEGPGLPVTLFQGVTCGKIVRPRGGADFGWDAIFEPDESNGLTYAEMSIEAKNAISHRGRAARKMMEYFSQR